MSDGLHWASALIGKRYQPMGRGPDSFDCWGLCLWVWKTRFGLTLPDLGIDPADREAVRAALGSQAGIAARQIESPLEGDALYLAGGRAPNHIGIWITPDARGGVLHAMEDVGVIFTRRADLRRLVLREAGFYRPKEAPWPTSMS